MAPIYGHTKSVVECQLSRATVGGINVFSIPQGPFKTVYTGNRMTNITIFSHRTQKKLLTAVTQMGGGSQFWKLTAARISLQNRSNKWKSAMKEH